MHTSEGQHHEEVGSSPISSVSFINLIFALSATWGDRLKYHMFTISIHSPNAWCCDTHYLASQFQQVFVFVSANNCMLFPYLWVTSSLMSAFSVSFLRQSLREHSSLIGPWRSAVSCMASVWRPFIAVAKILSAVTRMLMSILTPVRQLVAPKTWMPIQSTDPSPVCSKISPVSYSSKIQLTVWGSTYYHLALQVISLTTIGMQN